MKTFYLYSVIVFLLAGLLVMVTAEETVVPDFTVKSNEARIILIKPDATIGNVKGTLYVNGKYKSIKISNTVLSLPLESGKHYLISESPGDTGVTIDLKPGTLYYLIDPSDAAALKTLGDILYDKKNSTGALAVYRQVIKADPTSTGFYKRYAELVVNAKGKDEEVIKAFDGVIASNEADITTFLTLARIYKKKADNKKATAAQKKANYTSAVETYEKALKLEPRNKEALGAIAECKVKMGDTQGATGALEDVVNANPDAVNEYKKLGDLYAKQKQKVKAMGAYKKYLDKGGKNQVLAKKLGDYYYTARQYKDAVKYLAMVKGKASQTIGHQRKLADAYYTTGKYKSAIFVYKKLNAKNLKVNIKKDIRRKLAESYIQLNDNPKALYWIKQYSKISKGKNREVSYLNAYLQEKSNPAKAQTLYAANTKSFPRDHRNFLRLGMMYAKRRNTLSKAVVMLKKAVVLVDTIPAVWLEIAQVYGKLRKTNEELNAYKKYIQTDPENLEANIRVGLILLERNKISEGMGYLEKAHKKSPENVNVMVALAKGYVSTGRSQEALDLLTRAKKLKPGEPSIRRQLYAIYKEKGQDQQALDEIKQLLEIKRDSESLLLYAQLLLKSGDVTGAENAIEDIRATDPENIEALMMLATIYRKNKKYADAIGVYKEVNLIDSKYTSAISGQAQIHLIQDKILWAEKYFRNALKIDPDFAGAELGLAKIASLRKDKAKYKKHLDRAYFLDPKDPEIKKEYQKSKK